ncbi:MAG: GTP-binding protein [Deferribacteraceae bacterium]|nr:GTP-binding protein [Deferribacteraceae bacterium]
MVSKKVCMLGAFSVGKTSLVEQYVRSIFSDQYLSTVGVKISKKLLTVDSTEVNLVLWDMEGKDEFVDINMAYLRGAMGFLVVADLSRRETLEEALQIRSSVLDILGEKTPNILLLNKCDLETLEIPETQIAGLEAKGIPIIKTSAKLNIGVKEAFVAISTQMLAV